MQRSLDISARRTLVDLVARYAYIGLASSTY